MADNASLDVAGNNSFTISAWVARNGLQSDYSPLFTKVGSGNGYYSAGFYQDKVRFRVYDGATNPTLTSNSAIGDGSLAYVTMVRNKTTGNIYVYLNGSQDNYAIDPTTNINTAGESAWAGSDRGIANRFFNGSLDEIHIASTARSSQWIATEYNNQSEPTEFSTLGIEEVANAQLLSTFGYRKAITIDHTKVSGDLVNFPVLINLPTDASLAAHAQATGNDILFTSSTTAWNTGTTNDKLAHEIETYTTATGSLQAWVKIPNLSSTVDTVIYMYYGNAGATTQQNKTAVWDTNTKMVQHMNQTGTGAVGDFKDSTQYGNNSANTAGQPTVTFSGKIGNAQGFNSTSQYIDMGNGGVLSPVASITVSAWIKATALENGRYIVNKWNDTADGYSMHFAYNNLYFQLRDGSYGYATIVETPYSNLSTDWIYVTGTYNNVSGGNLYVNGVSKDQNTDVSRTAVASSRSLRIGSSFNGTALWSGSLDEVRISNTTRSATWIATEYNNQSSPSTFYSLSPETIYNLEITGSSSHTSGQSQTITLTAKDADGGVMTDFNGDASVTFSGANPSPRGTSPSCNYTAFGNPTTLTFTNGVATCTLRLYKAESTNISATGINTTSTNLTVNVIPNLLNNFLVEADASANSGESFNATVTGRDYEYNAVNIPGDVTLSVDAGTILPATLSSGDFTSGVWSGNLTISDITEQPSVAITASRSSYTGTDNINILGIPQAPSSASATKNTDYSMTLTWQDTSTVETGYKIERRENTGLGFGSYTQIGTVGANVSTFTDDETTNPGDTPYPDRAYQYQVRAYNSIGNSNAYSEDSTIHYTTANTPSNIEGTYIDDSSFTVSYSDQASVEDTHHIQRCSNANCGTTYETDLNTFESSPQTDNTSIYNNSRYRWQVRAETPDSQNSAYAQSNYEYTTPTAPTIQNSTFISNTAIEVNWIDNSDYEDGFRIEVSTDGGAYQEITLGTNTVGANLSSYTFTSSPDHNYKFRVRSHIGATLNNSEFLSVYSDESSTIYTTSSAPIIQTPIVNSSTAITWDWTDNSAFEEFFHLDFVTGSGIDVDDIPADSTSYQTTNLSPNTAYSVHIHSYRSDTGESDASGTSTEVYTLSNIPSSLAATPNGQVEIGTSWDNNSNPALTEYYIENINTGVSSGWITDLTWASNSLSCSTEYSFRVKSRNAAGVETPYSSIQTATTDSCSLGLPISAANPPQAPQETTDNPQGGFNIIIDQGQIATNKAIVSLSLFAGTDTTRMAISNSPDFSQASLVAYQKEVSWSIDGGLTSQVFEVSPQSSNVAHTVYAKFYTKYGAASSTVFDTIIFDTTAPELTLSNLKDKYLTTDVIIIEGITEPNSKIIYNLDSQRAGVVDISDSGKLIWNLGTLTAGTHSLKLITQDVLGNSSDTMQFFLNVEKPIITIPTTPVKPVPIKPLPSNPTNPASNTNNLDTNIPDINQNINQTPSKPNINVPVTDTPDINNPSTNNPDLNSTDVTPKTPASMQGDWNLLALKPFPKDITSEDIKMIIEKFPEFKETFQNLGLGDFTDSERLKNVSFNIPSLSQVMGLNPSDLTALNLPASNTPISQLSVQLKKEIPSNIVFVKTKENGIDLSSALSFEDGNPNQKISLLSGQSFQLVLRPDQEVNSIQGYITYKESNLSRIDDTNIIEKVASLFGLNKTNSVYAADDVEEKLVLAEFEYQDDDQDGIWTADVSTPGVTGEYELITVLNYKDINLGAKTLRLITVVDPEGYVYRVERDGVESRIPDATVSIYSFNSETKQYEIWDAEEYQQKNPQVTDNRGTYSFLVPPGTYYLEVDAEGYTPYKSDPFDVSVGSGVHMNLEVVKELGWKDKFDWQNLLLIVFGIAIFYNFYGDYKVRKRKNRGA